MPFRTDLLNPIPGDNPSGVNLRYDPVTDKIKEARREDLDVPQGEWKTAVKTADWNQVIKLAGDALVKKGKDLQIAVWLVDAHIRKEGFPMLEPGFQFLHDLLEQFWDTLHPEIEDGDVEIRSAPLAWLGSKLEEPLKALPLTSNKLNLALYQESRLVGYEPSEEEQEKRDAREEKIKEGKLSAEQFDESMEATPTSFYLSGWEGLKKGLPALESLSEFCDEKFGEFSPSFIKTRAAIETLTDVVEKILKQKGGFPEPAAEQEAAPPEEEYTPPPPAPAPAATLTWDDLNESAGGAPAQGGDREGLLRQLTSTCQKLRTLDPEDPVPYMVVRALRWAELMVDAPMISRSTMESPPSSIRIGLKRQAGDSDWDRVLETTETAMALPCGRTWLDLQRYTSMALKNKGYGPALRGVHSMLRAMLVDVPDLLDLILPDDTPAANQETKDWIDEMIVVKVMPYIPHPAGEESSDSDSSYSSDDTSSTDSSSETPSEETPSDDSSSTDTPAEEPAPELPPFTVDEHPPLIEDEPVAVPEGTPDIFDQAIEAVKAGNTAEGLGIIYKILATERTGRARFKRRTQLAHLLMAGGREKIAQSLLDQLVVEIEDRRLEDWEDSEALAYPLSLMLRCLAVDGGDNERRSQLYARICKLDPVRALNCSP